MNSLESKFHQVLSKQAFLAYQVQGSYLIPLGWLGKACYEATAATSQLSLAETWLLPQAGENVTVGMGSVSQPTISELSMVMSSWGV